MATSVRLDDEFVDAAQVYAEATKRSTPKEIEHWAEIGRIAEDNPDPSYDFIKNALLASVEVNSRKVIPYVRRNKRKD